jgi:hypothetical protein
MTQHIRNQHTIRIAAPAHVAFKLFTPAGEAAWVPHWRPRYLYPADGTTQQGQVFTTGDGDEFTIWQVADFDLTACRVRYVRTTPALRTGFVEVQCVARADGASDVLVRYELTALTSAGEGTLATHDGPAFTAMVDRWANLIAAQLPQLIAMPFR